MDLDVVDRLDRHGWLAIPDLITADAAVQLARKCMALLADDDTPRPGDKPNGGTRRTSGLVERVPEINALLEAPEVRSAVGALLTSQAVLGEVAFRCPMPGFGEQSLHSDDLPLGRAGDCHGVTAIVALCEFTPDNGATAIVPGSHRRPDLQRQAGRKGQRGPGWLEEQLLTGAAGTAFVFSAHLLHRGTRNRTDQARPALQAQWRRG